MITRRDLLLAAALAPTASSVFAADKFEAGKHYLTVYPPAPTSSDKIDVVLFFAYTCPHCLQFEPLFKKWIPTAPSDVSVRICPVAWQPKLLPFTQTYFTLEAMGLLDQLSDKFFESVVYQERTYDVNNAAKDIVAFMGENKVDTAKFEQTMKSFGVMNKARVATQTWQAYQIDSTPMIGVGGVYATGPHLVGSREETLTCIEYLIEQVRKSR